MADTMEDDRDRLKSALWYAVGQIVDEECMRRNRNATPQFIGALTELVWTQIENVAVDLESFANHASRSVVTTDDVLLLARKNPDLQQLMQDYINERKTQRGAATAGAARRKPGGASGSSRGGGGAGRGGGRGGARGGGGATRLSGR